MNTHTDTFTPVTVHFDDVETSFSALQDNKLSRYNLFITDDTYQSLRAAGHVDGDGPTADEWPAMSDHDRFVQSASDYAPFTPDGLRDISGWEVNFDR